MRDLPEWLEEFTENLDEGVLASRDTTASTSHDSDSERPTKVVSKKHSIFTHFPKNRNCEVCKRTKITRAPCRKHTGDAAPRAENFGFLITAYHKVLIEGCESRNNHRFATVVQDLATQSIRSYPYKTRLLRKRKGVYESFSSRQQRRKSFTLTIPWNLANPVKNYHGIILQQPRSETNGMAERAVRKIKEGTSDVLLQSCLDEKWWADSMECHCYL